ncbi:MAG: metal ABC transporter substrate-binding protein [Planctomycetes bacterium]|nr:metal ABC transporter substrate-binding protein [Planctomycetota bacterium]
MKKTILLLVVSLLCACGGNGAKSLKEGETLTVIATTPHLASLAMAIAGDDATVEMLAPEGANPHDYEPTVADRRRLQSAHLLLVNGLKLEAFDTGKIAEGAKVTLVDCSANIPQDWLIAPEESEDEEHEEHDHDDHDHDHGAHNPHVWLSIEGAIHQARAIADAMASFDASHAEGYRSRFDVLTAKLEKLRDEFKPRLAKLKKTKFVSNHDAFPYFAREFGLQQVGVIQRTPGHNPSMDERREIEASVTKGGANAIFMEPGFDDAASHVIAESTGLPLATLDPFGVGKPGADAYERVMRKNLETVLKTLGD